MREYAALRALRNGEILEIEGVQFRMIPGDIEVGDWYIAERNVGPKLLTARKIEMSGEYPNWIVPIEMAYCYDWHECVRVAPLDTSL